MAHQGGPCLDPEAKGQAAVCEGWEHLRFPLEAKSMNGLQELLRGHLSLASHFPWEAVTDISPCLPGPVRCGAFCPNPLRTELHNTKPEPLAASYHGQLGNR